MALTEEQRELIRKNRERALAIQREKKRERERVDADERQSSSSSTASPGNKRPKDDHSVEPNKYDKSPEIAHFSKYKSTPNSDRSSTNDDDVDNDDEPLEDFEEGASEFVTRQDAMKIYCLPAGTLDVCQFVEKPNPRNSSWKPMRLYHRKEIRKRARRRFGGLDGLVRERKQRENKRLSINMEKAKQLFR